jgi:hypothetical protein
MESKMETECTIRDLNDLRQFVTKSLCDQNNFEIGAFRLSERLLTRNGAPCGIYFCMHGPRSVLLTAIWETDRQTILFYDSAGERRHKTRLVMSAAAASS